MTLPPSQTLSELVAALRVMACDALSHQGRPIRSRRDAQTLIAAAAALAAQEASRQPDLAREWFEKGWQAARLELDKHGGEWHKWSTPASALAACRQEQP